MQSPEPTSEHRWLQQLLGVWDSVSECNMGPDQTPVKTTMVTTMRKLGELWIVGEMVGEMPDGNTATSIISVGFDPAKSRFVGSFISSVMTHLWPYVGTLDESKKILTLDSVGPGFTGAAEAKYQDIIEVESPTHYWMRSQTLTDSGEWHQFMVAEFHRRD